MSKIHSAVKLPKVATDLIKDAGIELDMFDALDTPSEDEIVSGVSEADALISGVNVEVTDKIIKENPDLKVIANVGAGFNNIDIDFAEEKGIPVTNTPTHDSVASTAELAMTLLLALSRKIIPGHQIARQNEAEGWQVMGYTGGHQVTGKKLAILGFGNIGQNIARLALAFEMDVIYYDPQEIELDEDLDVKAVDFETALEEADYIILQMNYSEDNHYLIGKEALSQMKESAFLINTARGGIVDEEALADVLEADELAGAALDVHEEEPLVNERLAQLDQVILTPHTGNDTYEARNEMAKVACGQAIKAIQGVALDYVVNGK